MGALHESIRVACPFSAAETYLCKYLERYGSASDSTQFNMRLEPAALRGLALTERDRGVHVAIRPLHDSATPRSRYRIRWSPECTGPHTLFFGELALERLTDQETFSLRLDGRYEVPSDGVPGGASSAFSQRIALATAAALLAQIDAFVMHSAETERARRPHTNGVAHGYVG